MICQMHIALCLFTLKDELFILTIYGYVSIQSTKYLSWDTELRENK